MTVTAGLAPPRAAAAARIARIEVVREDIFTPTEVAGARGLSRLARRAMNALHVDTREWVVRQELLFAAGDTLDAARLAETERNLRALGFLTNVTIAPTDTLADGAVVVRVHVQETWSLKTEFAFSRASSGQTRWNAWLSDENCLGLGVRLGLGAGQDEDRRYTTLESVAHRVLGSRWRLDAAVADLTDGRVMRLAADRPFYALADAWGLEARAFDQRHSPRWYFSNAGPAGSDPDRRASLHAPVPFRERRLWVTALRRVAGARTGRVWRLGGGFLAREGGGSGDGATLELSDGRTVDAGALFAAGTPGWRDRLTRVGPALALETTGRRYAAGRFLLKYGVVEDVPLSPAVRLDLAWAVPALGADRGALLGELAATDWSRVAGGLLLARLAAAGQCAGDGAGYGWADGVAAWFGGIGGGRTRLAAEGAWGDRLAGREAFVLGLLRGLRTLEYDGRAGDRLLRWNAEQGWLLPGELLGFYRLGLAAFYGGGDAWWHDEPRGPATARHEAGLGLRIGSSRSARADLARLDLTWPLDGGGPQLTAVTGGVF